MFLDLDHVNLVPLNNAAQQLVNTEDGAAVRDVMVGGRFVLRDGDCAAWTGAGHRDARRARPPRG